MKALEDKILKEGSVLPGQVLKVGSFLNHQMDVPFIMEMGREIAARFRGEEIDKILTVEASGIALAFAAAYQMGVPLVFAKKNKTSNVSAGVYTTAVHSYTHGREFQIVVSREVLHPGERILLIDDFLANGCALRGLMDIAGQAGAAVAGCATAIEKGFQGGGDALRSEGIRVESLAILDGMEDGKIIFRHNA